MTRKIVLLAVLSVVGSLCACGSSVSVQTDSGNQNVEIIEANVEVSDEYKSDDVLVGESQVKKFEFTQEHLDKTLRELTHDGEVSYEYIRNGDNHKPLEGPTKTEEIPVDFDMTFGELTDNGLSNYSYTIGDDVGYKMIFISDEKDASYQKQ